MGLEEQLPGGILLSTVEKVAGYVRKNSLWPATFGLACCAIEMMATAGPRFDIARFGMERFSATPRQADLMIVAGRVSQKMAPVLRQIYDQMAEPKWVLAMGVCASSGGMFNNYAIVQGVDHVVPVDIYLPGCPPRPEMLLNAILKLHEKIQEMPLGVNRETAIAEAEQAALGVGRRSRCLACCDELAGPRPEKSSQRSGSAGTPPPERKSSTFAAACSVSPAPVTRPGTGGWCARSRSEQQPPTVRRLLRRGRRPARRRAEARRGFDSDDAIEKVVVDRDELTLHVRRDLLPQVAQHLRDEPELRFELCLGVNGVHYPHETAGNCTPSTRCSRSPTIAGVRLEVAAPDGDPHIPSLLRHLPDQRLARARDLRLLRDHLRRSSVARPGSRCPTTGRGIRNARTTRLAASRSNTRARRYLRPTSAGATTNDETQTVLVAGGQDWDNVVQAARNADPGERIVVNMGPQHPSTHGVLRLILEIEGETVTEARCGIGYLHTGIEKNLEYRYWTQGVTFVTRMDYLSPFFNETAFCLGVEKLLGITDEIPERVNVIRVMMMELNRISSHLVALATGGMELGAMTPMFIGFRGREIILTLFESITGLRMNSAYIRPGGVAQDLPPNAQDRDRRGPQAVAGRDKRDGRPAQRERHLESTHRGRRLPGPDRMHGTGHHRADTAFHRVAARPAQERTLLRIRELRIRRDNR